MIEVEMRTGNLQQTVAADEILEGIGAMMEDSLPCDLEEASHMGKESVDLRRRIYRGSRWRK